MGSSSNSSSRTKKNKLHKLPSPPIPIPRPPFPRRSPCNSHSAFPSLFAGKLFSLRPPLHLSPLHRPPPPTFPALPINLYSSTSPSSSLRSYRRRRWRARLLPLPLSSAPLPSHSPPAPLLPSLPSALPCPPCLRSMNRDDDDDERWGGRSAE